MTTPLPEPERWVDRRTTRRSAEDMLGRALRGARAVTTPPERLLARVEAGFAPSAVAPRRTLGRFAVATLVVVLALGGAASVARGRLGAWAARHGLALASSGPTAALEAVTGRRGRVPVASVTESITTASQAPKPTPARERAASPAPAVVAAGASAAAAPVVAAPAGARAEGAPARSVEASSPAPSSPALEEARVLQRAFHALRAGRKIDEALAALDEHDRRFPDGVLAVEARLARIEALLTLGRRAEALSRLDAWDVDASLPRTMRLARGELRADAGRCAEAASDFSAALVTTADDEVGGRALYGRASCALRAGDDAAASEALNRYLETHAAGPQAAAARDALARLSLKVESRTP